jgi:hypothetical protein
MALKLVKTVIFCIFNYINRELKIMNLFRNFFI